MSTRPKISWPELAGAPVGLWGLGVEGSANLRRLRAMGTEPVLVEDVPGATPGVLALGSGGFEALRRCEVVVKSPGVSRYRPEVQALEAAGVAVAGGLGLWMEEVDRSRVVCVTGTKGKSTTVAIAGHLLRGFGRRPLVAGNLGQPPWDPLAPSDIDCFVVETSSFQATDVASSPPVVAVTSLHADHLDWHGDAATYMADKLSLCTQGGAELVVADGESPELSRRARLLGPRVRWVRSDDAELGGPWLDRLGLPGSHNRRNALIARVVAEALTGPAAADPDALAAAAAGFEGLESRLRHIAALGGVDFVDDGLSTNVLAALAALDAFPGRRVALLVGGFDRGIDYEPLGAGIARRAEPTLLVTMPDSGPRIGAAVARRAGRRVEVVAAPDLGAAVAVGFSWARPDGVVLLSPAAPSFGRFSDYRQRSAAFAVAVASLGADRA
jgi:UDP-N-acetylmuramoylalanine--D-glutamate ligase